MESKAYEMSVEACLLANNQAELKVSLFQLIWNIYPQVAKEVLIIRHYIQHAGLAFIRFE
jgi:hypothetical protein